MNAFIVIGLFFYVSKVLASGNGDDLIDELAKEKNFLLWFFALLILYTMKDKTGKIGKGLWLLFVLSSLLQVAPAVLIQIDLLMDRVVAFVDDNSSSEKIQQANAEVTEYIKDVLNIDITKDSSDYATGYFNDGINSVKTPQD